MKSAGSGTLRLWGSFAYEDKADPCHYAKLFHNALMQLKTQNSNLNLSIQTKTDFATQDYISFLFEKLEHRRITDNIILHIELGKSEFHRSNYLAAKSYFHSASEMLTTLPNENSEMFAEISIYRSRINSELK